LKRSNLDSVAALVTLSLAGCLAAPDPPSEDGLRVGAPLSFTGDSAASGTNLERALLMAGGIVNANGGVAGQPIRVVALDTHSDLTLGIGVANALLRKDPIALIGAESEDLTKVVVPSIQQSRVPMLSPGVMGPLTTQLVDAGFWFKMSPSGLSFGRTLAQRIIEDGFTHASVVWVNDEFGQGFASVFAKSFMEAGGTLDASFPYEPEQNSFSELVRDLVAKKSESTVLIGYPTAAARIIADWSSTPVGKWYFSQTLETDVFVRNVPANVLNGMTGVSVRLANDADQFAAAFQSRWFDRPINSAYFYYDSMAVLSLAVEQASKKRGGGVPSRDEIRDQISAVTNPPGEPVSWNDLPRGLALVREGTEINYEGASGSVDLNDKGEVANELVRFWKIANNQIVREP
jgi:branched-chain amino acid transport system substrate-binding protein